MFEVIHDDNSIVIKVVFLVWWHILSFLMCLFYVVIATGALVLVCVTPPLDVGSLLLALAIDVSALFLMLVWILGNIDNMNFSMVIDKESVKVLTTKEDFIIPFDESFRLNLMYDVIIKGYRRRVESFVCFSSSAIEDEEMRKKLLNSESLYYIENTEESKMIGLRCSRREEAEELYDIINGFLSQCNV